MTVKRVRDLEFVDVFRAISKRLHTTTEYIHGTHTGP